MVGEFIHQYFCTLDPCSEFKFCTLHDIWTRLYNKGITVPFSELKDHQHIQKLGILSFSCISQKHNEELFFFF